MFVSSLLEMMSVRRLSRRRCFRCWHPLEEVAAAPPGERGGMPDADAESGGEIGLPEWNPNIRGERVLKMDIQRHTVNPAADLDLKN